MSRFMSRPNESLIPQVSKAFLRGLESDLRGLSADARKRSPALKEEAERVILCLKEADTSQWEAEAADKAAAVFCSACEKRDNPAASSHTTQVKVALRAVSSLHKLLIHRAVYPSRLPEVLNALERLSDPCVDDNVTLKVLQGILSILTIRGYTKSLAEKEILQAFSLLFMVNSSRPLSSGHTASAAFSSVSPGTSGAEVGVIEQTAKAAFRQVTSDLFASAADAAIQTAVERKTPSSEFIAMDMFPVEVKAAFNLFMDLINAASGDALVWIPPTVSSFRPTSSLLDVSLAIEVLDDNLASNIALFAGQPVFSEVLSARLCPVIHRLLKTVTEKLTLRSLLSLVVSLVRHYWRSLQPDTEALLHGLARMSVEIANEEKREEQWAQVYAIEALRCIFRRESSETSRVLDLVRAFDLRDGSGLCVGEAVQVACKLMSSWKTGMIERIPASAFGGGLKPFVNTIRGTKEFRAGIATSLYCQFIDSAWEAAKANDSVSAKVLMRAAELELAIRAIEQITDDIFSHNVSWRGEGSSNRSIKSFNTLVSCLARTVIVCDECKLEADKELAIRTLSTICSKCVASDSLHVLPQHYRLKAVDFAFGALLEMVMHCRESLGRSWLPILRAIERLDGFISIKEKLCMAEALHDSTAFTVFTAKVQSVLELSARLSWKACHDMITAFVQCSRQMVATLSRSEETDEVIPTSARADSGLKIFGMASAESSFLNALNRSHTHKAPEPSSLWQLLSSHLTSVCMDSTHISLRNSALKTLTRLVCGVISSSGDVIPHNVVLAPFLDLLASNHLDVSIACVSSMYTLLTTQGERLSDGSTWHIVLQTLSMAGGYKLPKQSSDDIKCGLNPPEVINDITKGAELVSEGFKVVQVVASDFLTSLSGESLFSWAALLRIYCLQNNDVNVALTAVGLLWRTADFLARSPTAISTERIWVALVITLKDISLDERPEVRRCAIKTLMGALSSHASKISPTLWGSCLQLALIPLLKGVLEGGLMSLTEENLTPKTASEAPLLLHHSRDTPRKQWNETRVLALSGIAQLLRVSLPYVVRADKDKAPKFDGPGSKGSTSCWKDLFSTTTAAACSRDAEVAVAGVSAILDYIHSIGTSCSSSSVDSTTWNPPRELAAMIKQNGSEHEGIIASYEEKLIGYDSLGQSPEKEPAVSEVDCLWEEVWSTLGNLVCSEDAKSEEGLKESIKIVNQKAVLTLVEGLLSVWHDLQGKFSSGSCETIATILILLSFASSRSTKLGSQPPEELVQIEQVALSGLEEVATTGSPTCKFSIVCQVLQKLSAMLESAHSKPAEVLHEQGTRAIRLVKLIFEQNGTPVNMRLFLMPRVITTLKPIITGNKLLRTKQVGSPLLSNDSSLYFVRERPSWVCALDALSSVMKGIPPERFGDEFSSLWVPYLQIVEEFVFHDADLTRNSATANRATSNSLLKQKEQYSIQLTRNAVRALTHKTPCTGNEATQYLLRLLTRGAEEGMTSGRPQFVQACQKILFSIADENVKENPTSYISSEASRFILRTCDHALRMFILDDQRAGRCPLPAKRREEIVFLLSQLILLQRKSSSSQNQVLTLYPRLCECVESRDEALRCLARKLLDEVAPSPHKEVESLEFQVTSSRKVNG